MKESIISIEECDFGEDNGLSGYKIMTDKQTILIGIDNGQCCCENWGYLSSEDDFSDFIGSYLVGIEVVNNVNEKVKMVELYEGSTMFVDVNTSVGKLQFVCYNEHNGYYGHEACIISTDLTHSEIL